jgi:hypothetical protein
VLQKIFINGLAALLDHLDRPLQIDGVPQHYGGSHQIEAGSAIALVLETAVHLAEPVEEHGSAQCIAGLPVECPLRTVACRCARGLIAKTDAVLEVAGR